MTLIAIYNSEGCQGRCDSRCHDAEGPDCDCICGGMNHGVGLARAESNTRDAAERLLEQARTEGNRIDLESINTLF